MSVSVNVTDVALPEVDYVRCVVYLKVGVVTKASAILDNEVVLEVDPITGEPTGRRLTERKITDRQAAVETYVLPVRASYTRRTFLHAGEAEITILGSAMPWNPLTIMGGFVRLYMGRAEKVDEFLTGPESDFCQPKNERFTGYIDQIVETQDEKGAAIVIKCRDMTSLFLDFKPLPADAVPKYSDTLREAVQKIVGAVVDPFVAAGLPPPIQLAEPEDPYNPFLWEAAHERSRTAPVPIDPKGSAWSILEHVCGLVSATAYVYLNEVTILEAEGSYGADPGGTHAHFIFGEENANLLKVERTRKFDRNRKGVRLVSYDPEARKVIDAQWPIDPKDLAPHARLIVSQGNRVLRQPATHTARRPRTTTAPKDLYEVLQAPNGIADRDFLQKAAKAAYLQRSLGDLEGKIETIDFRSEVLNLKHADRIVISINPSLEASFKHINTSQGRSTSDQRQIKFLANRLGMSPDALVALVDSTRLFPLATYFVRSVTGEFNADGKSFVTIEFLKLTDASGSGL